MLQVFEFTGYKEYLNRLLDASERGVRSRLAQALECQPGYISQVLSGKAHFSLEQAAGINEFAGHTEEQAEYFLLLVMHDRAGTGKLRATIDKQLTRARQRYLNLKTRFKVQESVSPEVHTTLYSSWMYLAVLTALTVPQLQTIDALSKRLSLSKKRIVEILEILTANGLATQKKDRFVPGQARSHLGKDSPMISKHHINWRLQAIRSLEADVNEDLHYSSVISVSAADIEKIKAKTVQFLSEVKDIVRDSAEERLYSFCADFFEI